MSKTDTITLVICRKFSHSAERVFDAWLNPDLARKFLYTTAESEIIRCEIDARVGGDFVIVDRRNDGLEILHRGTYKEIDRPRRLVFTLQVPQFAPEEDDVTVEIIPTQSGCEVVLKAVVQTSVLPIAPKEDIEQGWTMILSSLDQALPEIHPPACHNPSIIMKTNDQHGTFHGPAEVRLVRTLPGPIERIWDFLTDPQKRARWFAGGPMEPKVGGKMTLQFQHKQLAPDEEPPAQYKEVHETGFEMPGTILRWEPPRVLSYTFDEDSDVTFELTPEGKDVVLLLTHRSRGVDIPSLSGYASGWHTHFAVLIAILEGSPVPPFWATHGRLKAEYEKLRANA